MTIKEYLQGLFEEGVFTDANFNSIFAKWGVESSADLQDVSEKERDLCEADLCLLIANKGNGSGETIERGEFKVSEKSWNMTWANKELFLSRAYFLYRKYGVDMDDTGDEQHYQIGVI
jgi:hypothetical protein